MISIFPSTPKPAPKVYVTNKELLSEIHKSKNTFCYYEKPEHANYDVIVRSLDEITDEMIAGIRAKKAKPRGKAARSIDEFPVESLVFRLMTFDHIPLDPDRARKPRNQAESYAKTPFPPFKHFMRKEDGSYVEVLRSHWSGGFDDGEFTPNKGRMSNHLGFLLKTLTERYSMRKNWRGYSYRDEMCNQAIVQLVQVALQFDESKAVNSPPNPFAFYTTIVRNCFVRILNSEKKNQAIRDALLSRAGVAPSFSKQIEGELSSRFAEERAKEISKAIADGYISEEDVAVKMDSDIDDDDLIDDESEDMMGPIID